MEWYLAVLKKYAVFQGRARRKEYWMFTLISLLVAIAFVIVDSVLFGGPSLFYGLYGLAVLLPGLAVTVRRIHDTGRSGWWLLIAFVPIVGLVLLYFLVQDSQEGSNEHGAYPKPLMA
jgi:uncharacterized membrane protein YhaH (DUF805 family)